VGLHACCIKQSTYCLQVQYLHIVFTDAASSCTVHDAWVRGCVTLQGHVGMRPKRGDALLFWSVGLDGKTLVGVGAWRTYACMRACVACIVGNLSTHNQSLALLCQCV
jgi:hypothetical protein